MCLPENKNRGHLVQDFIENGIIGCGIPKISLFVGGSFRVSWVKFEWKFVSGKKLKFYIPLLLKGFLGWTVVKNGVIGCTICIKKEVYWQAQDIGWHYGNAHQIFPLTGRTFAHPWTRWYLTILSRMKHENILWERMLYLGWYYYYKIVSLPLSMIIFRLVLLL